MADEGFKRKLTAILSADVEGYSRLMGENEEATVRTLTNYRTAINDLVQQYRGRVVDTPGDNLLTEFTSVVDAVNCSMEIQRKLAERNTELPDDRKMQFRIGLNVGDVVEEEERIYGDGVNIAARLEGLADPGGICISGRAYDQVENKLDLSYEYIGEHAVKNIKRPLRVYRIGMETGSVAEFSKAPEMPKKTSIAVLPFVNISDDADQEYFSDGITEDLITDLSKLSDLFVIARNSVFAYKGMPRKVQSIGRDLRVQYILEGSVRKVADRVRITAQLVETSTGDHIWAERYDQELKDIFSVQDEVTKNIVDALALKLTPYEENRLNRRYTQNLEAYDYALRGLEYYYRYTKEANLQAQEILRKAIELDAEYAVAYSRLALTYLHEWTQGWSQDSTSMERAFELAQKAISLDDSLPEAHRILGDVYLYNKDLGQAGIEREKAIALNPNYADGLAAMGEVLIYTGKDDEGIAFVKKAMKLNPHHHAYYLFFLAVGYAMQGRYEDAIEILERALIRNPNFLASHLALAHIYGEIDRISDCRAEVEEVLKLSPGFSLEHFKEMLPVTNQSLADFFLTSPIS